MSTLQATLKTASVVAGLVKADVTNGAASKAAPKVLKDVLKARLQVFDADATKWTDIDELGALSAHLTAEDDTEEHYQLLTGIAALRLLSRLAQCEREHHDEAASRPSTSKASTVLQPPVFGLRDLKAIQTLASIVTRWGFGALLEPGTLPAQMYEHRQSGKFSAVEDDATRLELLRASLKVCLGLLLPDNGVTEVKRAVQPQLFLATLAASLVPDTVSYDVARKLLTSVAPALAIATLLSLVAVPPFRARMRLISKKTLSGLLSEQLIRPGGVVGLFSATLARTSEEPSTHQYEVVAELLSTPPSTGASKGYYDAVWHGLLTVLKPVEAGRPGPPSTFIRAACFCISRTIKVSPNVIEEHLMPAISPLADDMSESLDLLTVIVSNIEPSSANYDALLTPLMPQLLSAWIFAVETKADPVLRQALRSLLDTWAKSLPIETIVKAMSVILEESPTYNWRRSDTGGITYDANAPSSKSGSMDLDIKPNPSILMTWLKGINRPQILTKLMISWLEEVQEMQRSAGFEEDFAKQKAVLLRLQLLQRVIDDCGSDIVKNPQDMLVFIDHALELPPKAIDDKVAGQTATHHKATNGLGALHIAENASTLDSSTDEAADLDLAEAAQIASGDQLTITGLTLLLSVLEANINLSVRDTPTLASIDCKLELLAERSGPVVTRLAADARLVLGYRKAADRLSADGSTASSDRQLSKERELYLEALKLLQHPIIPIRAQGLSMLRDLASPASVLLQNEPGLVAGILDLFIQTIQHEDSFIYLNAIRGLSSMVDRFGKAIAARLVEVYHGMDVDHVGEDEAGHRELDKRLRCGEALTQVVERAGTALATFGDLLIGPTLHILRTGSLPVILRSSALTILSACTTGAPIFMLQYLETLFDAMLDLLRLVTEKPRIVVITDETPEPLEATPTHPSLRRAAILLLHQIINAVPQHVPQAALLRLQTVVEYTKLTDPDDLVRHNAGIVCEDIGDLL